MKPNNTKIFEEIQHLQNDINKVRRIQLIPLINKQQMLLKQCAAAPIISGGGQRIATSLRAKKPLTPLIGSMFSVPDVVEQYVLLRLAKSTYGVEALVAAAKAILERGWTDERGVKHPKRFPFSEGLKQLMLVDATIPKFKQQKN